MTGLEESLPDALDALGRDAPHDTDLVGRVRAGARRRRLLTLGPTAAVLAVAVVLGVIWAARPGSTAPVATAPSACQPLQTGPLPVWARTGFSHPDGNPFALSADGTMVAVVFANPLMSPPAPDRGNKILWVPEQTPAPSDILTISAALEGSDLTTIVDTGTAPGPSYVDLPAPGCWHLDLTWGAHSDSIDLRWENG
jgi:hypothetical protein